MDHTIEDVVKNLNGLRDQVGIGLIAAGVGIAATVGITMLQRVEINRLKADIGKLIAVTVVHEAQLNPDTKD